MKKLNELTIKEAIEGLKKGDFKSRDIVEACLNQISDHDQQIKSFITIVKESALKEADEADKILSNEGGESAFAKYPLLGIPYACKDNFNTKGIQTSAGSKVLEGYIAPYESTVTKRLKEAGAVLLGKTNMDAFAHGSSTETSDFFPTHNPWDLSRVPGGSSGGSAAAVAAHMCIFSIGSETGGSIRGPASWCGITGLKPTYGRVSRYGVIAMASSTDSPGPITKNIEDASYVLKIIAGHDPYDATSSNAPVDDYSESLNSDIKGLKIGLPKSYLDIELEPEVKDVVLSTAKKYEEMGAELVEMDLLSPKYSIAVYTILQRSEVSSNLARFDGIRYGNSRDSFGMEARKRMMLGAYTLSSGYYDAYYSKAQKVRTLIVNDFNNAFKTVDVVLGPTMPSIALHLGESEKSPMFGELMDVLTEPSAIAGLPAVSFNAGFSKNMPVGVQIIGPQLNENVIIKLVDKFQKENNSFIKFPELKKE